MDKIQVDKQAITDGLELPDGFDPGKPLEVLRHEAFVQRILSQGDNPSAGKAYAKVYARDVDNTAYVNASNLLKNPKVRARLDYLRERAAEVSRIASKLDEKMVLEWIADSYLDAVAKDNATARGRMVDLAASVTGIKKEPVKIEGKQEPTPDFSSMTTEQIQDWQRKRREVN